MAGMGLRHRRLAAGTFIATIAAAMAWTAWGNEPPATLKGYLGADRVPDERIFLPPPPADGSIEGAADLAIFRATRAESGSERWRLAVKDNAADPAGLLDAFGCALGTKLKPGDVPALDRLLEHSIADTFLVMGQAKERYLRARPFLRAEGATCIPATTELGHSGSYPSGHATVGWLYGLILGEVAPDRASALLARGRTYGESRIVCGVHYPSDIDGGRTLAAAMVSTLHSDARFRDDLAEARAQFEAFRARAAAPDAGRCTLESSAVPIDPGA